MKQTGDGNVFQIFQSLDARNGSRRHGTTYGMFPKTDHHRLHQFQDGISHQQALDNIETQECNSVSNGRNPSGETKDGGIDHLQNSAGQSRIAGYKTADFTKGYFRISDDPGEPLYHSG
jgi:hypothetical protein